MTYGREYVMSEKTYTRLQLFYGEIYCLRCGKPIQIGDEVVSKNLARRRYKIYHKHCYDELYHEA